MYVIEQAAYLGMMPIAVIYLTFIVWRVLT